MTVMSSVPGDQLQEKLRALPSVDALLGHPSITPLLDDYPRGEVLDVVRAVLDDRRSALRAGHAKGVDIAGLALEIRQRLYQRARPNLKRVINATGIVLHTNLGRAPLAPEAVAAIAEIAAGYCNLELDLESGRRGSRYDHLRELLRELCAAEDGLVVNNNAAATYLVLNTFAAGREVIISRGQLVEIGGSYRLPEIMAAASCRMVEVGTTNRTRLSDFERAINSQTALLLRVHTSNYRVVGFTESVPLKELVTLARRYNLLMVDDLGSGLLTQDLPRTPAAPGEKSEHDLHLADEPSVRESLASGADLALFSGDKLLGGPQAGVIVGRADLIGAIRRNPLTRAVRPDKLALAALEATLRLYRDPATVVRRVPVLRALARSERELHAAAERICARFREVLPQAEARVMADHSEAGGGSLAAVPFPTWVVEARLTGVPAEAAAAALRRRDVPVVCRIRDERLVFDPRTLDEDEAEQIVAALADVARELTSSTPPLSGASAEATNDPDVSG